MSCPLLTVDAADLCLQAQGAAVSHYTRPVITLCIHGVSKTLSYTGSQSLANSLPWSKQAYPQQCLCEKLTSGRSPCATSTHISYTFAFIKTLGQQRMPCRHTPLPQTPFCR